MFNYKAFRKDVGLSQIDLAELLGCKQPNISAMEKTNKDLEASYEKILIDNYGRETVEKYSSSASTPEEEEDFVPLLPVEAMAGSLQGYSEGVELANCRKIKSPVKGADWAIQISGDSMEPDYKNGSYLFIKKMTGSFIPWGQTMVVDTYDGVVVKDIYPVEENQNVIEARSINKKYPPFRIEKTIVIGIYRVLGGTFINSTI
ncbi:MAG: helix-turn-helix transcriptional regulator [Bacteroidales bacterium]|nr:helix-turn-helix transcriptional regulator [Bacteroidales bacterium]